MIFMLASFKEWLFTASLGLLTYLVVRFYLKVAQYPKGPTPLPFIGNILNLRGIKHNAFIEFANLAKKYGPVYTFWLGTSPLIIISDLDLSKEAFNSKNNEFNGRPFSSSRALFVKPNEYSDVLFGDDIPTWASLRRVAHSAVRKFANNSHLPDLVSDVVDETVNDIKQSEGIGKPFDPCDYLYLIIINIIATTAFGKRYQKDDPEFVFLREQFESFRKERNARVLAKIPIIKLFYKNSLKRAVSYLDNIIALVKKSYQSRSEDFEPGTVRDFSDALISAKEEAIRDDKESAPYLTDINLSLVLSDLFFAGSDTSNYTLRWIVFYMAKYPSWQAKLRQEVSNHLNNRIPVQADKQHLHQVQAFISECLRHRPVVPMSVSHRLLTDGKIDDHRIPFSYNVMATSFVFTICHDPRHWSDPNEFNPDRFLEDDRFLSTKPAAFCPFGVGKRVCLGEKLALEDLFLVTVRLIQMTEGFTIAFPDGPGDYDDEPDPNMSMLCVPKPFRVALKRNE